MIVGGDDITSLHKAGDHVQIAAGMLAESVDDLNDSLRFAAGT